MAELKEQFKLTEHVRDTGYFAEIPKEIGSKDTRNFAVSPMETKTVPTATGIKTTKKIPGSVMDGENVTGKDYFEDLTAYQIHILSHARVIHLTPEQIEKYYPKKKSK